MTTFDELSVKDQRRLVYAPLWVYRAVANAEDPAGPAQFRILLERLEASAGALGQLTRTLDQPPSVALVGPAVVDARAACGAEAQDAGVLGIEEARGEGEEEQGRARGDAGDVVDHVVDRVAAVDQVIEDAADDLRRPLVLARGVRRP